MASYAVALLFTPLVESLLREGEGTYGMISATTGLTNLSGLPTRLMLARRFFLDSVVTSHDPKSVNFSVDTKIHESLLVFRRRDASNSTKPTRFISLRRMPSSADEVSELLRAVDSDGENDWCRIAHWPNERVKRGDWRPAQFYDATLVNVIDDLARSPLLVPLEDVAFARPGPEATHPAFVNPTKSATKMGGTTYPVMWTHSPDIRKTMYADPEVWCEPKPRQTRRVSDIIWPRASNLLLASRPRTTRVRTASILVSEPVLGAAWIPVTPRDAAPNPTSTMKAWCVFLNSTVGALNFLNRRNRELAYPRYNPADVRPFLLPDPTRCDLSSLSRAFDSLSHAELLPWPEMQNDPVRHRIDDAVSKVLGIEISEIADWRRRIANEPTVSNRIAEH